MNKTINFPCVMLEKANTNDTFEKQFNQFSIIRNEKQLNERAKMFNEPVICHDYSVINEALRIEKHFN